MRKMSKVLAMLLTVAMLFSLVTITGFAATGALSFSSPSAVLAGATNVVVEFNVDSNPGLTYLQVDFTYDDTALELVSVEDKGLLGAYKGYNGSTNTSKKLSWQNGTAESNFTATGVAAVLTFNVKAGTSVGEYPIGMTLDADNTIDFVFNPVAFEVTAGKITVFEETDVTAAVAAPSKVEVSYGADAAAVASALAGVTVTGSGATTGGAPVSDVALTATWNDGVDTTKVGEQEVTAKTLTAADGINVKVDPATVKVTVDVKPLKTAFVDEINTEIKVKKGETGDKATLAEVVADYIGTVGLKATKDGDVVEEVTVTKEMVTVAADLDTSVVGNTTTATVKIPAGKTEGGIFDLAEALTVSDNKITLLVKKSGGTTSVGGIGVNVGGNIWNENTGDTTEPEDTTTEPEDTTTEPEDTTTEPEDTTTEPGDTTTVVEFEDVAADYWAVEYIKVMKELGIVNGKTATAFEPDSNLTRAEFAKMIAVAMGLEATATDSKFADSAADAWYTPYVIAVTEAGLVNGISEDMFGADQNITRQDIATILARIAGTTEGAEVTFTDAGEIADYAVDGVAAMVAMGVIGGYPDGSFAPAANATRAEVCKMMVSFITAMADASK